MANYIAIQYLLKQIIGVCKLFLFNNMYQETFHVKETWCKHKCMIRCFLNGIRITCIQNVGFNWIQLGQIYFTICTNIFCNSIWIYLILVHCWGERKEERWREGTRRFGFQPAAAYNRHLGTKILKLNYLGLNSIQFLYI